MTDPFEAPCPECGLASLEGYCACSDFAMVQELCEIESGMNDWELRFVNDLSRRFGSGERQRLSERQRRKALDILKQHA